MPLTRLKNRPFLRSVLAVMGSNMASTALGAAGGLLAARFLGPGDTGLFRSYGIPLAYLGPLHMTTLPGLWRQLPYYSGKGMPEKAQTLASAAGAWNQWLSMVVSGGFLLLALGALTRWDLVGAAGWAAQALCAWGIFYGGYLAATYRTIEHFAALARNQFLQALMNFGLVFTVPALGFYGLCIRAAAPALTGTLLLHRERPMRMRYRHDRAALVEMARIGVPLGIWGGLYTSVWQATEAALMLSLGGATGLGLFSVAAVIREAMSLLPASVQQVLMPKVVERFARDGSVRRSAAQSILPTVAITIFTAMMAVIASYLLALIVPLAIPRYTAGVPLMQLCLWFAVVQAASLPLNTLFATGRSWNFGRGVVIGMVVFPLVAYLVTPALGSIMAVAVGSLVGRIARTLVAYGEVAILAREEASGS